MNINRDELTKIIETNQGQNWWQPDLFAAKTQPILPQELEIVSPPPQKENNYNCFAFVFGLQKNPDFLGGKNPIQQEFIKYLIAKNILTSINQPTTGSLVFYKNDSDEITHGGIMELDDWVLSKWMWGPLIRHKLLDVPSSFGDTVLFFKSTSPRRIENIYRKYVRSSVKIKPIF